MDVRIFGADCALCIRLEAATRRAFAELGIDATVTKVTDLSEITSYGLMSIPVLVIDGQVKAVGRVPRTRELHRLLLGQGR